MKYFREAGWKVQLHGVYDGTLRIFKIFKQQELFALTRGNPSLPFAWGYNGGHRKGKSMLMIARPNQAMP